MTGPLAAPVVPRLRVQGLGRRFGGTVALDGVDWELRPAEVHALLGENGAGKSTLVRIVGGADAADVGSMWLDGRPYRPPHPLAARRLGVAMVHQELSLAPHLSVAENICLGSEPGRFGLLDRAAAADRARRALTALGHPEIDPGQRAQDLAPAARQIVEIARGLAADCRVLVLDEPTSSLGHADTQRLFALIERLRQQGPAIVFISHFLEEALAVADRYTVLRDGRVVGGGRMQDAGVSGLAQLMAGRRAGQAQRTPPRKPGPVLLEVEKLSGRIRPADVSFALRRGEVLGLAGLLGSGRTELLRVLFGLDPMAGGRVVLHGGRPRATPACRLRAGMGMLSEVRQDEGLALRLSIADNIVLSRLEGLGPGPVVWPERAAAAARRWTDALAIRCRDPRQQVLSLSGGNQQKVALARLLHHDVEVLLLDEPTRGIDVASREHVYALIDALARQGKAVVMASSHLPELLRVADRIGVMWRGGLLPPRPAEQFDEPGLLAATATGRLPP